MYTKLKVHEPNAHLTNIWQNYITDGINQDHFKNLNIYIHFWTEYEKLIANELHALRTKITLTDIHQCLTSAIWIQSPYTSLSEVLREEKIQPKHPKHKAH